MTPPARVLTVILNWNQPAMTAECAAVALSQQVAGGQTVLVIDNGSTPGNAAALRAALPAGCRLVTNPRNLGFAGGMNGGLRHALRGGYEYAWLLNNDAFPDPGCLAALVAALDADPVLGCVTPSLYYPGGAPHHAGGWVDWETGEVTTADVGGVPRPATPEFYVTGAALLVRTAAIARVGGFDGRFFAYWEEADLCARLVAAGWGLGAVPDARCLHREGVSSAGLQSPTALQLMTRNRWLYLVKRTPLWRWPRLLLRVLALAVRRAAGQAAAGRRDQARGIVAGLCGIAGHRYDRPARPAGAGWLEWVAAAHRLGLPSVAWKLANLIAPESARRHAPNWLAGRAR